MKTFPTCLIAAFLPLVGLAQAPILRNAVTTNQFMNLPADLMIPFWNAAAGKWSNALTGTATGTNGNTIWVDAIVGNDSTGLRNDSTRPFLTPYAAKLAAQPGDIIKVRKGTYAGTTNLFKSGLLTWHFDDAILTHMGNVLDHGCAIFDDRFSGGAVSNTILGALTLNYCPGTNVHWDAVCSATGHTNAFGAIVVTNALSDIRWYAETRIGIYGPPPFPSALYVRDCFSNTVFNIDYVFDGHPFGTNFYTLTNCPADPNTEYLISTAAFPLYWVIGTLHVTGRRWDNLGGLAVQAYNSNATDKASLYLRLDWLDGKIYVVGKSSNYKLWADILEWQATDAQNGNAFNAYGSGSHYLRAQKMSTRAGPVIRLENPGGITDTNLVTWVDIDKVSHSNGWVRVEHGQLRGRIGHFEQNGPNDGTPGIFVTNISAFVSLSGENASAANTIIEHGGGVTELRGYNLRSTNRDPILVTGSGLTLSGVTANGPTNSIRAATVEAVIAGGTLNGPPPNGTITMIGTNRAGFIARPFMIVTNFGTIEETGDWIPLVIEEWVGQPTSATGNAGVHHWNNVATGTLPSLAAPFVESNAWSYISIVTTQSSSGRVFQTPNFGGVGVGVVLSNASYLAEFRIRMNTTNLSGDVATTRVGLTDLSIGTGEAANGVYVMNNTNVNTNIFVFGSARGSARTFTYSPGIPANTYGNQTWTTVVIYVPAPGHTAYCFVGPDRYRLTSIATNTANLPGDTVQVGVTVQAERIASTSGTNFRTNYCDRAMLWVRPWL